MTAPAFIVTLLSAYVALLAVLWASDERRRRIHAERKVAAMERERRTMKVRAVVTGGTIVSRYTSMDSGTMVRR